MIKEKRRKGGGNMGEKRRRKRGLKGESGGKKGGWSRDKAKEE